MTQCSMREDLFSITVSDRNWWEFGRQTVCNYSTEGTVVGSRQPPRQDSYCLKGRIAAISNHHIKLSHFSLCALHRWTGRLTPAAQFLERQKPFPNFKYIIMFSSTLCRLGAHTSHDL